LLVLPLLRVKEKDRELRAMDDRLRKMREEQEKHSEEAAHKLDFLNAQLEDLRSQIKVCPSLFSFLLPFSSLFFLGRWISLYPLLFFCSFPLTR
jgi:hypothetical protein